MTLEELENYLNTKGRWFLEANEKTIKYTFHSKTINIDNLPNRNWELKEDGRFYIETTPTLTTEEYRLMWIDIKYEKPLELQLTSKMTDKHFIDLVEETLY